MLQQQHILTFGRRLLALVLLFGAAFLYLISMGSFLALRTEDSADLHTVFIILGYAFLLFAAALEFIALRFALRGLKRTYIALGCLLPIFLVAIVSIQSIRHRNFTTTPGGYHRHRHHWWHLPHQ